MKMVKEMEFESDLVVKCYFSDEDTAHYDSLLEKGVPLPCGIMKEASGSGKRTRYYQYCEIYSIEEKEKAIKLLQLKETRALKKCGVALTIIAAIGLIANVIIALLLAI